MGNNPSQYAACSNGFLKRSHKTGLLLDTAGNIRKLKLPVKSAEIMIEDPGHVITPVDDLRRTHRIAAVPADQELLGGKAYLLVPASRVHSKASELEMAITERWDCEKKKRKSEKCKIKKGVAKVIPVVSKKEGQCQRFGNPGRWNPVLEPILESL